LAAVGLSGITLVPRHVLGGRGYVSPSDKLDIAGIGAGGRGVDDLEGVSSQNIVALADVDERQAADSYRKYSHAKRYKDFRKMLDTEKSIDAVVRPSKPGNTFTAKSP
jgi:predicted dehydrogenase